MSLSQEVFYQLVMPAEKDEAMGKPKKQG